VDIGMTLFNLSCHSNAVRQSTFVFILPRLPRFLPKPRNDMLLGHVDSNWIPARWPT